METENPLADAATEPRTGEPGDATQELAARISSLTAERDQLAVEKAEIQDLLVRRQAEFDNARRRAERERADTLEYASMDTVKALLPVLDDFERALKMMGPANTEGAGKELVKGVELIHTRLLETLKKLGLEPVSAVGKPFDPHLHEAIDRAHTADVEDQTVLDEYQSGYQFRGKLLRPAMVKVAVNP